MSLHLKVSRKLSAQSERVKCVEFHPSEPWLLAALYDGLVNLWNYECQQLLKSIEVSDTPVRLAKFIPRKTWIITGSDDMHVRVYNCNSYELVHKFQAHSDFIRSLVVHPSHPYLFSSSDDMTLKLWDWDKQWSCVKVFEGHAHYVMQVSVNPKDDSTFATASLDRTIKVWQLRLNTPDFSLEGHEMGVNCVEFYPSGEKLDYLISGSDDRVIKIWDYQARTCVISLNGHEHNITDLCFHPESPVFLSGAEDGTIRIWNAESFKLESVRNYKMDRVWAIHSKPRSKYFAIGYDQGCIVETISLEEPV